MAMWERDPKANRRIALLLVVVEAVAALINFFFIFQAYFFRVQLRLHMVLSNVGLLVIVIMATAFFAVLLVYEGMMYLRGRAWVRQALLAENGVLIGLGILLLLLNRLGGGPKDVSLIYFGLLLPLVTLFPLLWPLLVFRVLPQAPAKPGNA